MTRTLVFAVALAGMGGWPAAAQIVDTPRQYVILRPAKPVVVDGKLDEWDMTGTPYVISPTGTGPMTSVHTNDPTNPPGGDSDLSGKAALAWDDEYLYVAGRMIDDHLRGVKPDSVGNQGPAGWGCDSLMVSVASFRQPMKTNSPFSATPMLGLRYAPMGENPRGKLVDVRPDLLDRRDLYWVLTEHSQWAVAETPNGYDVEAAVPWKDLAFVARPGERLFISFLAADVDPDEALNQVGWGFTGEPKDEPLFRLAGRRDLLGTLTASADEVPADEPWAVRAELDALEGTGRIESVRVVDATGQTVATRPVGLDVPEGKTGTAVVEFPAGAVGKPGHYAVEELASPAGKAAVVIATVPVTIVEPKPAPPLVRNLPGEIHHMPPARVAHNAYDAHRRGWYKHGFVAGKEDYVPYIRKWCEPSLKVATRQQIKANSPHAYHEAFRCTALYRITGDKEYADLARQVMDITLDQLKESNGWFRFTATTLYRYLTWLKEPDSPFAPKDAERRYREGLYKVAAEPNKELFAESGTHNRVWHRYAVLKVARIVAEEDGKPIDPRVIEYVDYHDKLIGAVGDSDDASPGYHWVFFDAAAAIYFHTGDWDAFLKHPGYMKTMRRYVEMVSPSGAAPQFASCSGWPTVGMSMWAYEWVSNLSRDGRFRWTSHRIAEYYYNHLDYHANQYHGPFDTAINNFVLAYLLADDAVPPKPPPSASRVTWRHPLVPVSLERRRARPGTSPMEMDAAHWIPDKVVLSSGDDAQNLWGLVELLPKAGHGGEVPGNLIALMIHDAALLSGQGYYENVPSFQNLLWIEDLDGLASDPRQMTTEVPVFVDDPAFTFVRIVTAPYQHLPVTYTRDILFYKNGFMVVKDRAKFETTMKVRLGPCIQTRSLGPECGPNWFNAYYDELYYTGLGLGRGVQSIENPAWDLMVYFTPREGRKHTVVDRYLENPYRGSPVQLRQVWSGMARAGQEITFTTLLLPHVPTVRPSELIEPPADSEDPKRIEVVADGDDLTVAKLVSEIDPVHKFRYETWVMLNDTGKSVEAGPLASDARLAIVGLDRNGEIGQEAMVDGTTLRYRGRDDSAKARKHTAEPLVMPQEFKEWKRP